MAKTQTQNVAIYQNLAQFKSGQAAAKRPTSGSHIHTKNNDAQVAAALLQCCRAFAKYPCPISAGTLVLSRKRARAHAFCSFSSVPLRTNRGIETRVHLKNDARRRIDVEQEHHLACFYKQIRAVVVIRAAEILPKMRACVRFLH